MKKKFVPPVDQYLALWNPREMSDAKDLSLNALKEQEVRNQDITRAWLEGITLVMIQKGMLKDIEDLK